MLNSRISQEIVAALGQAGPQLARTVRIEDVAGLRAELHRQRMNDTELRCGGAVEVAEYSLPDRPGVSVLTLTPSQSPRVPRPLIFYVHGGGMVAGHNRLGIEVPLPWVRELGVVVTSVEYRLAPEQPFPVPFDDCTAALDWIVANADRFGIDVGRVVIAGTSAGGGIAAGLTLLARDRRRPAVAGQLLMSPMLDDRGVTRSSTEFLGDTVWDRESNMTGWRAYLGKEPGDANTSPYAAAARAVDLAGLPPTYMDTGSVETFRDEVVDYAARMWSFDGHAELRVWPGALHGFDVFAPRSTPAISARKARLSWLAELLDAD